MRVRGPRNHFPLVASPRYLFIAGGIGITPLLPMIAEAHAAGADWRLLYGGRERASMAFLTELADYGDRVMIVPQEEQGMLDLESALGCHSRTRWSTAAAQKASSRGREVLRGVAAGFTASRTVQCQAAGTGC